jgi:hypothetical protein
LIDISGKNKKSSGKVLRLPEWYRQILESGRSVYQPLSAAAGDQLSPEAAAAAAGQLLCFADAVVKLSATPHQLEGGEMHTRSDCLQEKNRLKGLSHEIDFKNFDKKLHNLA